jgi:uncharacterized glyoxalase superfamily protein PhnB
MASDDMFSHAVPVLPVDNLRATIEFYEKTLGFGTSFVHGDPPYYGIVRRGEGASVHFSEREDTSKPIVPCTVYVFVTDVDAVYKEFNDRGIDIFLPPEDQQYGMREFELADNNGHFLIFGQETGTLN